MADKTYLRGYELATQKMAVRRDILASLNKLTDADQDALLWELIAERGTSALVVSPINGASSDFSIEVEAGKRGATVLKMLTEADNGLTILDISDKIYVGPDLAKNKANTRSLLSHLQDKVRLVDGRYFIKDKVPNAKRAPLSASSEHEDISISDMLELLVTNSNKGMTIDEALKEINDTKPGATNREYVSVALRRLERDKKTLRSRANRTNRPGRKIYYARTAGGESK